jgi:hypothetical protein
MSCLDGHGDLPEFVKGVYEPLLKLALKMGIPIQPPAEGVQWPTATAWLTRLYGLDGPGFAEPTDLMNMLRFNTGFPQKGGGVLTLGDFLQADLVDAAKAGGPKLQALAARREVYQSFHDAYGYIEQTKNDDPDLSKSLALLPSPLDREAGLDLCELALQEAPKEIAAYEKSLPHPRPETPGRMQACVSCHAHEMSPGYLAKPENRWWVNEALLRVESGDMPRGKAEGLDRPAVLETLRKYRDLR